MSHLPVLLPRWQELLQQWAGGGQLVAAASEALCLASVPEALRAFSRQLAAGDFQALPPVDVLPADAMPTARGAYAVSTGTIYLNGAWLEGAGKGEVLAVLTEELGHHLDAQLNASDTPGDEGEVFAALLLAPGKASTSGVLAGEDDRGVVWVEGRAVEVEQAAKLQVTPVRQTLPGRTAGEAGNEGAFAALKLDGSVVTWGSSFYGGDSSGVTSQLRSGISQIFSTNRAFAALKVDGSVVTWGNSSYGGDSSKVAEQLRSGVSKIFSTGTGFSYSNSAGAFAALKTDGSVVTWGGLGGDSRRVAAQLSSGVSQIFSSRNAFAALKADGSVVTWGGLGDGSVVTKRGLADGSVVSQIFSTEGAFAALKTDGSVVTWGEPGAGGDIRGDKVDSRLRSGVTRIFSTAEAFAALKSNGSVVTWGGGFDGGDSSKVAGRLSSGVSQIFSTNRAFAALKTNGSVVTWGEGFDGGDSSKVAGRLSSGVSRIISTGEAFAALKSNGSVVTWGDSRYGGDSSGVASKLSSGVSQIFSTQYAFAALKTNGSVVTWGSSSSGGDSSKVAGRLRSGVTRVFSTPTAFAALKSDGSVVTWGSSSSGGDSSKVASRLSSGVVSLADPFTDDRLVFPQTITLGVSPALVTEDGTTNLVYTFTRTGPTSSALRVNYKVGGTALLVGTSTNPADYTGIATAGDTKTVTFAVGASKALVTVDPKADTAREGNETVALTLAAGSGYVIGTTGAVVGIIRNDDPPQTPLAVTPIRQSVPGRTPREARNLLAFAALKSDGSVVTWGNPSAGGDSSGVAGRLSSGVTQIFSNGVAFAALKTDGSVVTWGAPSAGGDSSGVAGRLSSGVSRIFSNDVAFAALKTDGSVVTWGNPSAGGDSSGVTTQLSSGVSQIFSTEGAFAALKSDGSVVTWGPFEKGGDSRDVASKLRSGVSQIFSSETGFAALKTDGSVVGWGNGGNYSGDVASRLSSGVTRIFSTRTGFAALKTDGSVVTWGGQGGYSGDVADRLRSGVSQIFSTGGAFAALKADGSVVTWGAIDAGGDSSTVAGRLSSGVLQIFSTYGAFAALKADGSVVTWGNGLAGGDSSVMATPDPDGKGYIGKSLYGKLRSGVVQIFSTASAFAALKTDDSVVAWGNPSAGGDISGVAGQLSSGVSQIFSTASAFAALKIDGSVVTWGNPSAGGDSRGVAGRLRGGVVSFANPFTDDRLNSSQSTLPVGALGVSPASPKEDSSANSVIVGKQADFLDGRAAADIITGKKPANVFAFRHGSTSTAFADSPLRARDEITDFVVGVDRIALLSSTGASRPRPTAFSRAADNNTATTLSDLTRAVFADANGKLPGNQPLDANSAALVVAANAAIAGTYLVINDGTAGRSQSADLLIKLSGVSPGALPALGSIEPSTIFL